MGHEIVPSSSPHRRLIPASMSSPFKRPGSGFQTKDAPDLGWKALLRRHRFLLLALTLLTLLCSVYLYFAVTLGAKLHRGGYVRPRSRKLFQHQENMDAWGDRHGKLAVNSEVGTIVQLGSPQPLGKGPNSASIHYKGERTDARPTRGSASGSHSAFFNQRGTVQSFSQRRARVGVTGHLERNRTGPDER